MDEVSRDLKELVTELVPAGAPTIQGLESSGRMYPLRRLRTDCRLAPTSANQSHMSIRGAMPCYELMVRSSLSLQ